MTSRRRGSNESFQQQFQQGFVDWQLPAYAARPSSPAALAEILGRWAAERPEDAGQVQQLAAAVASLCLMKREQAEAAPVVAAGLDASMLGAPLGADRLRSAIWLSLLGARLAFEADDVTAARVLVDRAGQTADQWDVSDPLDGYFQLHRSLMEARLAEAAREIRAAQRGYSAAANLAATLSEKNQTSGLLAPWAALLLGPDGPAMPNVGWLLHSDLDEGAQLASLGLARTSAEPGHARDAVNRCVRNGLPLGQPVLELSGLLDALPPDEIDDAADRLGAATDRLEEVWRVSWLVAVRAAQAQAWLFKGEPARADAASNLALDAAKARHDACAGMMAVASKAASEYAMGDTQLAWYDTLLLLDLLARISTGPNGSRLDLQARAVCEPALTKALQHEAARLGDGNDEEARRRVATLIDALRSAEDSPLSNLDVREAGSLLDRAEWLAGDRIGRLAYQANRAGDVLLLVVQNIGKAVFFIAIGAGDRILATVPSQNTRRRLMSLSSYAEQAVTDKASDERIVTLGKAAFDAFPAELHERLSRVSTVVIVPDLSAGFDRVPFELLHDGSAFLGVSKILCRCLSLSHALRVLEPAPVAPEGFGRRALCVAVGNPPGLPPLPYAATEPTRVTAALNWRMDSETLLESAAAPDDVLALAPLAQVLHFACHGDSAAGAEALILGDGARLRAIDIATQHRLRGTTYLNACALGGGRYVGGGHSRGAAYAFARAGSSTVLANLLPVADQGAADLAEAFYIEARNHSVGEALRLTRARFQGRLSAALWSTTVLIGDPYRRLDGSWDRRPDDTSVLYGSEPRPSSEALQSADPDAADVRLTAAVDLANALMHEKVPLDRAARIARALGLDITEAHCLLELAAGMESADVTDRRLVLRKALKALEPLRGLWQPAYQAHRDLLQALRSLDPAYRPRKLETFRFDSGLTVNDRSDPAVDTLLSMHEAQFEHEAFWRGEPELVFPDVNLRSFAHNAIVWGFKHHLYGTNAESAYALACAKRLAWRGLLPESAVPHLHRVWAALLHFLWGQQYVTHLQGWMLRAHTRVLEIALDRVNEHWAPPETSPALPFVARLGTLLDAAEMPPGESSPFARARAALTNGASVAHDPARTAATIKEAVQQCRISDAFAAADLGAWIYGDLLHRESNAADHPQVMLAYRTLTDELDSGLEGWIYPYLMDGFAGERETAGMDLLTRWSNQVL